MVVDVFVLNMGGKVTFLCYLKGSRREEELDEVRERGWD